MMTPYALDEAHRLRCLAALGIDGSVLRADLYVGRRRGTPPKPADATAHPPLTSLSLAEVRQSIGADEPVEQIAAVAATQKPAPKKAIAAAPRRVHQPALEAFTLVTSHAAGPHWFGVFSGESKEPGYKSQRALFQSICGQFSMVDELPSESFSEREPGLTTIFGWPPLKPSVLGLLGSIDPLVMYQRCIAERVTETRVAQRASAGAPLQPTLLFTAELEEPESAEIAGPLEKDEHCLLWREILDLPEEVLSSVDRLIGEVAAKVILLPPLSRLLTDASLRRSVQTVLLLLTRRSGALRS